MFNILIY